MTTYTSGRVGEAERKAVEQIGEELSRWPEGYAEYQLREAIAEARKRLGKEYTREIVEAEMN